MEEIPSWYSPIGHLLATAGIGAGTVAFALSRLSGVSALEAVLVPVAGFVIANGFEWRVHKDVLHKRRFPFGELFDRHTPNHHVVSLQGRRHRWQRLRRGEIIRRLLLHPDVELVRVASIDYVGEPLSRGAPEPRGARRLVFENLSARRGGGRAWTSCSSGCRTRSRRTSRAGARSRRARRSSICRGLPAEDVAAIRDILRRRAPLPRAARRARVRPARAEPRAPSAARATSPRPAASPRRSSSACSRSRRRAGSTARSRRSASPARAAAASPQAGTHHPVRAVNLKTYKPLSHQHMPEIAQTLDARGRRRLRAPLRAGVGAALARHLRDVVRPRRREAIPKERAQEAFARPTRASRSCACRRSACPRWSAVAGSNYVEVGFEYGPARSSTRTLACFSAIDNLIKGGAGQAVQSMNLVLGLDETLARRSGRLPVSASVGEGRSRARGPEHGEARRRGHRVARARARSPRRRARSSKVGPRRRRARRRPAGDEAAEGPRPEPKQIAGRRVTDEATLDVMKMVVAGKLNVDLCARSSSAGARPSASTARARGVDRRREAPAARLLGRGPEPDRSRAGRRRDRRHERRCSICSRTAGYTPVLACLGAARTGRSTTSTPTSWRRAWPSLGARTASCS
jgi:N-acetyl-gamma-glutamyl-phosphate/LysW-gamma-L-alpha-aminoadipyl-6-phosphate reductase